MSKFKKKKSGDLPAISTASLPDIVFMLLFFFMVATVMRENELSVENNLPLAGEVEKLSDKNKVAFIYIGKPNEKMQKQFGTNDVVQLGDKISSVKQVQDYVNTKRNKMNEDEKDEFLVSLKVDRTLKLVFLLMLNKNLEMPMHSRLITLLKKVIQ